MAPRSLTQVRRTERTIATLRVPVALLACLHVALISDDLRAPDLLGPTIIAIGAMLVGAALACALNLRARVPRALAAAGWAMAVVDALALIAIARTTVEIDPSASLAWAFVLWVPFSVAARASLAPALASSVAVAVLVVASTRLGLGSLHVLPPTWGSVGVPGALVLVAGGAAMMVTRVQELGDAAIREQLTCEQDQASRLREADDLKNTFLAAVSHELRTPLTSILGFSLTMLDRPELDDAQRERMLRTVVVEAEHLEDILANLLDLDRLTRGKATLHPVELDPAALVRTAVAHAQRRGTRSVKLDLEPGLRVRVDASKVERVVDNIVGNALKYTPPGGEVLVTMRRAGDGIDIRVDDRGPGIPAELRESIFEPFQRGEDTVGVPGTGIGLSLVDRFTRLHGGRAWIEDRPGGGCRFQVHLPSIDGRPGASGNETLDAVATGHGSAFA